MQVLLIVCLLPALALASPRQRREADPQFLPGHPLLYHAPNCTTEEETITLKQCVPKTEEVCEDVEVPTQKIELEDMCVNVTVTECGPEVAAEEEGEEGEEGVEEAVETVKRSADASAQFLFPGHHLPYHAPHVLLKHACKDVVHEECYKNPVVKKDTATVKSCQLKTDVECTDVEHTVPRTVCSHEPHPVLF